ncbi:MAG TPA: alpha/beta hydrolase [Opitutus sp.]|nr:alpha/beta hydrolase [Opitutus sp.]
MKTRTLPRVLLLLPLLALPLRAAPEPPVIPVWPGIAPGAEGRTDDEQVRFYEPGHEHIVSQVHRPTVTVYLPAAGKATGAGLLIIPGGGHRELWMDHEGYNVGRWCADHGIAGFVLKYRLAHEPGSTYRVEVESLADAQRALRLVRSRAQEWGVDPERVGVIGFSAGGELAALVGQRFGGADPNATDPVLRQSDKPAFQALVYPGNSGSIVPTKDSPPAFLLGGYGDNAQMTEGLAQIYIRFKEAGVPAELHIYSGIGHGFGIRASNHTPSAEWPERFREWLAQSGFLDKAK